ncbi:MAG: immunity 49 family protein [Deltaproteobacteria bacterium]
MTPIKHHSHDRAFLAELASDQRELLEYGIGIMMSQSEPRPLASSIRNALWIAGACTALDPAGQELCTALRGVSSLTSGLFRLMVEMPGEYPIPLGDGRRAILHNIGVTSETSVGAWHKGFYAACVVRDESALQQLASTPVASIRRSPTRADDSMFLWIETLQSWHTQATGTAEKLKLALEATDPARSKGSDPNYILNILVPVMELLLRVIEGKSAPFNEALHFALERHKKYWGNAKNKTDPEGLIALGPLAMASLAHDTGIAIEVESDYLPRRLFEGACRSP